MFHSLCNNIVVGFIALHLESWSDKNLDGALKHTSLMRWIRYQALSAFYLLLLGAQQQRLSGRSVLQNPTKAPRRSSRSLFSCCLSLLTSIIIHHWPDYLYLWRSVCEWFPPNNIVLRVAAYTMHPP